MGEHRKRGRVLILLVLTALVLQYNPVANGQGEQQTGLYGGTLRVALKNVVDLNPLSATDEASWKVIDIVYDSLFRIEVVTNEGILPQPWLAESWTIVDDDTVTVKLRDGVEWHDSTDAVPHYITAADVVYTFNSSNGMKDSNKHGSLLAGLAAVELDPITVEFDMSAFENKGLFFTKILTLPLIPDGYVKSETVEKGCGPFRYKSRNPISGNVINETLIASAKGDETRVSMKHNYLTGTPTIYINGTIWSDTKYDEHLDSGSLKLLVSPPPTSRMSADYSYAEELLTIEAFPDYFNGRPFLDGIEYSFFPDNPDTQFFDEGVDKAIIKLILKEIDMIGFGLVSSDVSGDRIIDPATGEKTKLSEETWKWVTDYHNRTFAPPGDPQGILMAEKAANDFIRSNEQRILKKELKHTVEENITGNWTIVAEFDSEFQALDNISEQISLHPEKDGLLRPTAFYHVYEFFLALDENPGFRFLGLALNTLTPPLNDDAFRLALANLMDRNTHNSLLGTGRDLGYSPVIPQNTFWYNESIPLNKLEHDENNAPIYTEVNTMLDIAGYLDMTGPMGTSDGFRDLPNGTEFSLKLYAPPITTAPVESSIANSIVTLMNQVGINTSLQQGEWGDIEANVSSDSFTMALTILDSELDPSFLYDMFHSSGSSNINNYAPEDRVVNETLHGTSIKINQTTNLSKLKGSELIPGSAIVYRNGTVWDAPGNYSLDPVRGELTILGNFNFTSDFLNITYEYMVMDHLLENADRALDMGVRQGYVKDALGLVAERVPMIPLVYYNVLEAYDQTVFDGWFGMPGGIHNFWSFINTQYIPLGELTVDVVSSLGKQLTSGGLAVLIATAKDQDGKGVEGVQIHLSEAQGRGVFAETDGVTDSTGEFRTGFTAPNITQDTDVTIEVTGTKDRYYGDDGEYDITVLSVVKTFRREQIISRPEARIDSGNTTTITVTAMDSATLLPIQGASVKIAIEPQGYDAYVATVEGFTDFSGLFTTTFSANVTTDTFFKITATVSKDGYENTTGSTSIKVSQATPPPPAFPWMELVLGLVVIVLIVLLIVLSFMGGPAKPKKAKPEKRKKPKPESTKKSGDEEKPKGDETDRDEEEPPKPEDEMSAEEKAVDETEKGEQEPPGPEEEPPAPED